MKLERLRICVNLSVLSLQKLDEVLNLLNVPFKTFGAFPPKMVVEALILRDFAELDRDLFQNRFFGANGLVTKAALE